MVLHNAQLVSTEPVPRLSRESVREQAQLLRKYRRQLHFRLSGRSGRRHLPGKKQQTTSPGIPAGAGTGGGFPTAIGSQGPASERPLAAWEAYGFMICSARVGGSPGGFHLAIKS